MLKTNSSDELVLNKFTSEGRGYMTHPTVELIQGKSRFDKIFCPLLMFHFVLGLVGPLHGMAWHYESFLIAGLEGLLR